MGLDMYAYSVDKNGRKAEIAYWRKNYKLHSWFEAIWKSQQTIEDKFLKALDNEYDGFNCVELELTEEDIDRLSKLLYNKKGLPKSEFAAVNQNYNKRFRTVDKIFVGKAKEELKLGKKVIYIASY